MCGIVGFLARDGGLRKSLGEFVVPMLTCMGERGPDSAGLAVFTQAVPADQRRFNLYAADRAFDWQTLAAEFAAQVGVPAELKAVENHAVIVSRAAPACQDSGYPGAGQLGRSRAPDYARGGQTVSA